MGKNLTEAVREFIKGSEGKVISLDLLRKELKIDPDTPSWGNLRVICSRLCDEKLLKSYGKSEGQYKVVVQYSPIKVFTKDREKRPPFDLRFPKDFDTGMELSFSDNILIREGDLITIGGVKSTGKTTLCMNFVAENINKRPILMGNEYTAFVDGIFTTAPRFFNRMIDMSEWVEWCDEEGNDKFTLIPAREDYAEAISMYGHNKINVIDWINLAGDRNYDIGKVLEGVKSEVGKGIAIVSLQKGEGNENPRGGQYVRDFSDLEIILDYFGKNKEDILLTIKGAKEKIDESKPSKVGRTYAYTIGHNGTRILDFREVKKCSYCRNTGYVKGVECEYCQGKKYVDA
jgi:hypothetical protein